MEARLQKQGNSVGIRIPSNIIKSLNLKINDTLELKTEENKIIITKALRKKISLEERFKVYNGKNLAKNFEWDEPQGKEIW